MSNELIHEKSPYLLAHAHNPVHWCAYSTKVFETAKEKNKPILLSIGYSTCHWCHVMEKESFENEEIANYMNEHYICVKVDREERPDVDSIYMSSVQTMTGQGGWPMTVWLLPDGKPFYAGTYFPPYDNARGPGFLSLLKRLNELYQSEKEKTIQYSKDLTEAMTQMLVPKKVAKQVKNDQQLFDETHQWFLDQYDPDWGGFGHQPKFPRPAVLSFLLAYHQKTKNKKALDMVIQTLQSMAQGGICDFISGTFHRYSVDRFWLVPHFEKMLYDNAQLIDVLTQAYVLSHDQEIKSVLIELLDAVLEEFKNDDDLFFSAYDADTQGHEGIYYVWTLKELEETLSAKQLDFLSGVCDLSKEGHFEGYILLHRKSTYASIAKQMNMSLDDFLSELRLVKNILKKKRQAKPAPMRDEKVLVFWNAMLSSALIKSSMALGTDRYANIAKNNVKALIKLLYKNVTLHHDVKDERLGIEGLLEDYASLGIALMDLWMYDAKEEWILLSKQLYDEMIRLFWDEKEFGFFRSGSKSEYLISREKPYYDGAEPSGNALAFELLLRLRVFYPSEEPVVQSMLEYFYPMMQRSGHALVKMVEALIKLNQALCTCVCKFNDEHHDIVHQGHMLLGLKLFYKGAQVIWSNDSEKMNSKSLLHLNEQRCVDQKITFYLCHNQVCQAPEIELEKFKDMVENLTL